MSNTNSSQPAIVRLLRPRSIAIVGASPTPGALGAAVLENLERPIKIPRRADRWQTLRAQ